MSSIMLARICWRSQVYWCKLTKTVYIMYTLPDDEPGKISLVDTHSNYIAVVFEIDTDESLATEIYQELCPSVRGMVYTNMHRAVTALHYSGIIPSYGFFCPKCSSACSTNTHTAAINSDHPGLTCSHEHSIFCALTEQQKLWLTGLQGTTSTSGTFELCLVSVKVVLGIFSHRSH